MPASGQAPASEPARAIGSAPIPVVVDTNVWLDIYVFRDPASVAIAQGLDSGALRAMRTAAMDAEIAVVLMRPGIARHGDTASFAQAWSHWNTVADLVPADAQIRAPWVCRDKDDQKFLDLAHGRRAAWLFSKDRAVLALARRARPWGLMIASPQDYSGALQTHVCQSPQAAPGSG